MRGETLAGISVVIPVYNGASLIEPLLRDIIAPLDGTGEPYELLLVEDGSRDSSWHAIVASDPDLILAMPCGYHRGEVEKELAMAPFPAAWHSLRAVRNGNVFPMDASGHFSRPGPRIAEGIAELCELFASFSRGVEKKTVAPVRPVAAHGHARRRT